MVASLLGPARENSRLAKNPWILFAISFAVLYGPTIYDLSTTIWTTDEQSHGPIVLALIIWLIYRKKEIFERTQLSEPKPVLGFILLGASCLLYVLARSQNIKSIETATAIGFVGSTILMLQGKEGVRLIAFPIFFMFFIIPLPGTVVDSLTQPMKMAVSYAAEMVLYSFGYPISRSGVILQIGQYQLLVADACAGMNTLFTLEAIGLLYLNIVRYASAIRNITLAILIIPISFTANIIRVVVLTLITYYLGDDAGQGFLHGFSGMVLFMSALLLIIAGDGLLRMLSEKSILNESAK